MNNHDFIGFVPHPLEIKERPELDVFPFNVLFAKIGTRNGKNVMGTALYEPNLESFKREEDKCSMKYHNAYGGDCWLLVTYDLAKKSYMGEKFVNSKSVGISFGPEWKMFFVHFAILGLTNGERCEFEDIG
ncbi:MAG: hypothetical protein WC757_05030 [Candidatus Paceibacterota bacterium]|jgi:hypothetical protein